MPKNIEKQFLELDKKAEKLTRESEKKNEVVSLTKPIKIFRFSIFLLCISVIGISVFLVLQKALLPDFKRIFIIPLIPEILISLFVVISIALLIFLRKKIIAMIISMMTVTTLVLTINYFVEKTVLFDNIFLLYIAAFSLVLCVFLKMKTSNRK